MEMVIKVEDYLFHSIPHAQPVSVAYAMLFVIVRDHLCAVGRKTASTEDGKMLRNPDFPHHCS